MSTASRKIEQSLAEDFALVKEKWGYETLKRLIMESDLFDVFEEQVENNICEVFRPKSKLFPEKSGSA